jgi:hypothetical protein
MPMGCDSSDSKLGPVICVVWFVNCPKICQKLKSAEVSLNIEQQSNTFYVLLPNLMMLNVWRIDCCVLRYYSVFCIILVK